VEAGQLDVAGHVRRARDGDRSAQEWLARRVYEVGLRLAAFSLGDRDLAQDVGQEAAIRALRSLARLRDPARFDAWAYRICAGEIKRAARKRSRHAWQPYEEAAPQRSEEPPHLDLVAERDWLVPALARLTERQRLVVGLRYVHDLTDKEIATVIRARRGTVRSLLSRALVRLREHAEELERQGRDLEEESRTRLRPVPGVEVAQ
jgi:RNA polymerase sigma factor (sigma-70 family)